MAGLFLYLQIHSSSPGPANSSTSNDALRNVSSNGAQNGQSNGVHLSSESACRLGGAVSISSAAVHTGSLVQTTPSN